MLTNQRASMAHNQYLGHTICLHPTSFIFGPHNLRKLCLARDGNLCVVIRKQDRKYIDNLSKRTGRRIQQIGIKTEAAHIIPRGV